MYALVFANGEFAPPPDMQAMLEEAELLVSADGGLRHLQSLGRRPQVLIGDLDSIAPGEAADLEAAGVELIQHPVDKDQTDLELALLYAVEAGAEHIDVLGGLGQRWDHSLANLLLPAIEPLRGCRIRFLYADQTLFIIHDKVELELPVGARLSLIPVGGDVHGVRTRGLRYPLKGETLAFGRSRGVSNVAEERRVSITVEEGTLLCVLS